MMIIIILIVTGQWENKSGLIETKETDEKIKPSYNPCGTAHSLP